MTHGTISNSMVERGYMTKWKASPYNAANNLNVHIGTTFWSCMDTVSQTTNPECYLEIIFAGTLLWHPAL